MNEKFWNMYYQHKQKWSALQLLYAQVHTRDSNTMHFCLSENLVIKFFWKSFLLKSWSES